MKKSNTLCFVFGLFFSLNALVAQDNLNNYKYVIVPQKFEFFKKPDLYQLNALTKFLFNKYGFTAVLDNETYPQDLGENDCLVLKANVLEDNSFMKTKLQVELRNCRNDVVYVTSFGESRLKEIDKAYHDALRKAFKSFEVINYKYKSSSKITQTPLKNNTINTVEKEVVKDQPKPVVEEIKSKKEALKTNKITENASDIRVAPEKKDIENKTRFPTYKREGNLFYLKPGRGGLYMVNKNSETVFKLKPSTKSHVFILIKDGYTGVAFYNEDWSDYTLEYYNATGELQIEIYKLAQ